MFLAVIIQVLMILFFLNWTFKWVDLENLFQDFRRR